MEKTLGSTGGPLQDATPERVNQKLENVSHTRDASVHDKIFQFNNMSVNMQSKNLERKTADAALKRAMLGREEAESDMRKYRDEAKSLRKSVEEGKDRERKVGERLEAVMENYGRAKETHAHTQALWEKEIRQARKETFKAQSSIVKLQEELKAARAAAKVSEENLKREKERSKVREQEAFESRYKLVDVQEQLDQALKRISVTEQERDAFKTAAKNEEVARIAAEGRIPLPTEKCKDDEFASPRKEREPRVSLSTTDIISSAASEAEIEELSEQVQWERQRANRTQEMVEFLQIQCHLRCCPCSKSRARNGLGSSRQKRRSSVDLEEPASKAIKLEEHSSHSAANHYRDEQTQTSPPRQLAIPKARREPRRSTIFCPKEGIFRTVSEQEAEVIESRRKAEDESERRREEENRRKYQEEAVVDEEEGARCSARSIEDHNRMYTRTPSVDPPSFAMMAKERTSLLSLLNAPLNQSNSAPLPSIPSVPCVPDTETSASRRRAQIDAHESTNSKDSTNSRSQSSAQFYTVTTSVPVRDDNYRPNSSFNERLRTPSSGSNGCPSFDIGNPALTPTMTREEALAQIRERRGRAQSIAQASSGPTPGRKKATSVDRRNMSAPTPKTNTRGR